MPEPRPAASPARPVAVAIDAQADLVRRYARILRTASTSASSGLTRRAAGTPPTADRAARFTRPILAARHIDDA
jgi:hypothetical protein